MTSKPTDIVVRVLLALSIGLFALLALVVVVGVLTRDSTYGGPLGILTGCLLGVLASVAAKTRGNGH